MSEPGAAGAAAVRHGRLSASLVDFGRALRRAGVPTDASRIALAVQAIAWVGVEHRDDVAAALEAVMVSREQDRRVFRAMFDAWFDTSAASAPSADDAPPDMPSDDAIAIEPPDARSPRIREALDPHVREAPAEREVERASDAVLSMSDRQRLQRADFGALEAPEYRLVEQLARQVTLPIPTVQSRRLKPTGGGGAHARMHWPGVRRERARTHGEMIVLPRLARRRQPLPLLILLDVSGSMERYARLLLAFLHASTRRAGRRDVFAFGTGLTDLTPAFGLADADAMLAAASERIEDFAGGTRLGASIGELRRHHARRLTGRRTLTLLITDGLDTGDPAMLENELLWLKRHSRRVLWLNPLLRFAGYAPVARGAAVLGRQADAMLAVHNLDALEQLAAGLARLIAR